jgi:hypothetical protein
MIIIYYWFCFSYLPGTGLFMDILTSENWVGYFKVIQNTEIRECWSIPICFSFSFQTSTSVNRLHSGVFLGRWSRWSIKLTSHLHLVLRVRTSGAIPLLPLYTSRASTWPIVHYTKVWAEQHYISRVSVCHFNFNSTKNCMEAAKIMHFCAQNHQLAVTQSSQQLVTSNINSLDQSTVSYQ